MEFSIVGSDQLSLCCTTLTPPFKASAEFISQFSNLKALTFQGLLVPETQHTVTFEWIPLALRGVAPTVRKFTMEVVTNHLSHLHAIPWSAIDEVLASQLQSVVIVEILLATPIRVNRLFDNVFQDMEIRLPLAAQRGVLRCSAVSGFPI